MIANKYLILEKITGGSFGTIVKGKNVRTNEFVAIKMELKTAEQNSLKNEATSSVIGNSFCKTTTGMPSRLQATLRA